MRTEHIFSFLTLVLVIELSILAYMDYESKKKYPELHERARMDLRDGRRTIHDPEWESQNKELLKTGVSFAGRRREAEILLTARGYTDIQILSWDSDSCKDPSTESGVAFRGKNGDEVVCFSKTKEPYIIKRN